MKHFILSFIAIAIALCIAGCSNGKTKYTDYSFECFDTVTTIVGYENSKEDFDAVCSEIKEQLLKYHHLYDIYNDYDGMNNLFTVNTTKNGKHKEIKVDTEIIELLKFSKEMYALSDGKVNVAMGSVLKLWHEYREEGISIPPESMLKEASNHTGINNVIIDENAGTVFLADPYMSIDVGAVAKGYALEKVARNLEEKGVSGYLLNVGGNVRAIGNRGDAKPWMAGVENPDAKSQEPYIAQVSLSNQAIATSGNYQRYYTVNGKNYHHIIDSSTLMPGENFTSVSVVCDDAGVADALSTTLFLMSYEEGVELSEKLALDEVIWVLPDGSIKKY